MPLLKENITKKKQVNINITEFEANINNKYKIKVI